MPRLPSHDAIRATLELRRWSRRQEAVTGQPPDPETVARRVARRYASLHGYDRAYVEQFAIPVKQTRPEFLNTVR